MKRYELAIVLIVLLTTSTTAAAVAPADSAGAADAQSEVTLTVTVTNDIGNGVDDAEITATWDGGSTSASTASNGKAFVDVEEGARVEIDVSHDTYTLNNPVVVQNAEEEEVTVVVSQKADAAVTVVDGGTSLSNARVSMYKTDQGRAAAQGRTNGDGVFESGDIEQGTYRVTAVKEGYLVNDTTVEVYGSTETTVALEQSRVNVQFFVWDDHFDDPRAVDGATVEIEGVTSASLTTNGESAGPIALPVNARYTVTVRKDGYGTAKRTVSVGETAKDVSFAVNRQPQLTVEAVNSKVVVGEKVQLTVTDEYGERVEGATVLVDGEAVGETDADGVYRAVIDSSGEHAITAEADGVSAGEITVSGISEGDDATPTTTKTETATRDATGTEVELPDFSQPNFVVKVGVAAVGVILAFLIVRRLL